VSFSDGNFEYELLMEGIVDVRLKDNSNAEAPSNTESPNTEAAINAPLAAGDNASNGGAERPKMAAILSAAAGTILVAAIIRKFKRGSIPVGDKYETDSDSQEEDQTMAITTV
jgi:hypothetical protein